jgi:hypothetical protein
VPCRRASAEIELTIAKYYPERKGNPLGVPVRVIAVNIEPDKPKQTAQFIKEVGADFVVNDTGGKLITQLNGVGTPFIVVIDGTRGTKESPEFRIVYKRAGFEGTKKLRQVIDAIKPAYPAEKTSARQTGDPEHATGPPVVRKGGIAFESLLSSDIQLTTTTFNYSQQHKEERNGISAIRTK